MALGVCLVASGCGVPDVTFFQPDASTRDVALLPDVASPDAGVDTGADQSGDAEADASPGAEGGSCPGSIPAGFVLCCNDIACGGTCKAADCPKCAVCPSNEVCCIRGQGATCNASGPCP